MKNLKTLVTALAGTMLLASAHAATDVVFTGATAFRAIMYARAADILTGETDSTPGNFSINSKSFTGGTLNTGASSGQQVNIHFVQVGSIGGISNLLNSRVLTTAAGGSFLCQAAFSDAYAETAGYKSTTLTEARVGVTPFVLFHKPSLAGSSSAGIVNINQRQLAYLFGSSGTLPTAYFGGSSTSDPWLLIGRDSQSGSRFIADSCAYFSGTAANYWTNTTTHVVELHPQGGFASGSGVATDVGRIQNSVGYSSPPDANTVSSAVFINYDGVPFTDANVENGSYGLWGYEHVYYRNSLVNGVTKDTILALIAAITDTTYQHNTTYTPSNGKYIGNFVPLDDMQVERTADGGPITSLLY